MTSSWVDSFNGRVEFNGVCEAQVLNFQYVAFFSFFRKMKQKVKEVIYIFVSNQKWGSVNIQDH